MGAVTNDELEQKIEELRQLARYQDTSIRGRLAADENVPTSDITGLAQLTVRIDSLERILEHRRSRAAGRTPARRQTRRGKDRAPT